MRKPLRVAIAEDHALTRAGLRTSLSGDFDVVAEAADGRSALELIERQRPDVAVVDLGLPQMDGIELTQRIRERFPEIRIVIVTMVDLEDDVIAALAAGADAYCLKSAAPERIAEAIRIVAEGGAYFDRGIAHIVLARFSPRSSSSSSPLTDREAQILRLIADGVSNADIAHHLYIGLGTVKGHIRDIMVKLAASDRTHAAALALRRGYIS